MDDPATAEATPGPAVPTRKKGEPVRAAPAAQPQPEPGRQSRTGRSDGRRSIGSAVLVGLVVGVAAGAICYAIFALPLYTLASFEPRGLDREIVRDGFRIAVPAGIGAAVIGGIAGGWLARRGTGPGWTTSDHRDRYTTR